MQAATRARADRTKRNDERRLGEDTQEDTQRSIPRRVNVVVQRRENVLQHSGLLEYRIRCTGDRRNSNIIASITECQPVFVK